MRGRELAIHHREQHSFTLQGVPLCPGRLASSEFAPLSAHRQEAAQAFWTAYFAGVGESTEMRFDSMGTLTDAERGCFRGNDGTCSEGRGALQYEPI